MDTIGARIRSLLAASTFSSQRELAAVTQMTPDALSRALSGVRGFSIAELTAIASALGVSLHFLATGQPDPHALQVAARHGYDHAEQTRVQVDWEASRRVLEDIATAYEQVDAELPVRIGAEVPSDPRAVASKLDPEGAGFVRDFAEAVERSFPIDVVRAREVSDGYSIRTGRRTIIAIDDTSNWFRQNWSLAHELGHIAAQTMHALDAPSSNVDAHERRANAFAAELLLPRRDMVAIDWTSAPLQQVASFVWDRGVSTQALATRIDGLHLQAGALEMELRRGSTQRFIRAHLPSSYGKADVLLSKRMQEASARRFPIDLLTAHRDAIEAGRLHAGTLAWMLDDDVRAIEAELMPSSPDDDAQVAELGALLGFEE